jgi:GNAT superfamily N-acetyltransferase
LHRKSTGLKKNLFLFLNFKSGSAMESQVTLQDIVIRTELKPGDLSRIISLHSDLYYREYGYGIGFETHVVEGLLEFYRDYNPTTHRVWLGEHDGNTVGSLALMNRGHAAQLRYFLIDPHYRGIGLGHAMIGQFMSFLRDRGYRSAYLWTTHEQTSAAALYKKYGFALAEEKESRAFGKVLREQRYTLELGDR